MQQIFERHEWKFCFIGGVANFRWGTPRLTNDLDLTLLTGFGGEPAYTAALLAEFESRISDAAEFALRNRVLLLRTPDGFGLDVALGAMPFEANASAPNSKPHSATATRSSANSAVAACRACLSRARTHADVRSS